MNYYKKLDINENSSQAEIKAAYRKLSMVYHPDRPDGDEEKFKQIGEAYETLSDPEKRQMYDMRRKSPFLGQHQGMPSEADLMNMLFGMTGSMPYGFGGPNMMGAMGGMGRMGRMGGAPNIHIFRNGVPVQMSALSRPPPIVKTITITL